MKLTRGPVQIVGVWGSEREREGWIYEDALALVRMPYLNRTGYLWSVTHIPTGFAAAECKTKPEALRVLKALLKIAPAETWRGVSVTGRKLKGLTHEQRRRCRELTTKGRK